MRTQPPAGIFCLEKRRNPKENARTIIAPPIRGAFFVFCQQRTMPKYNEKLVLDTITCFKEEDGIELTQEEAIAVLDSFAGLYLAFASDGNERAGGTRLSADGGSRSLGVSNTEGTLPNAT